MGYVLFSACCWPTLSKSFTISALDVSEAALFVFGLALTVGVLGEYKKFPTVLRASLATFEVLVVIGIAGELIADGAIFVFSRHLQTISEGEYAVLNNEAGKANKRSRELELESLSLRKELTAQGPRANLLYGQATDKFIAELKPFRLQKIEVRYSRVSLNLFNIDHDTMSLAMRLQYLLGQSEWDVAPLLVANSNGTAVWVTVRSKASESTIKAANKLVETLKDVSIKVNDTPDVSDEPRPPQVPIFDCGTTSVCKNKAVKLRPLDADTIVVTVLAHP
jgi:hypothetical protein